MLGLVPHYIIPKERARGSFIFQFTPLYGRGRESTLSALNFNKEFDVQTSIKDNPSYKRTDSATKASGSEDKLLSVYDVMLAGVEADD